MGVNEALSEAARFGASEGGGVTRMAWSEELFDAYRWLGERASGEGFETTIDPAGNLRIVWPAPAGAAIALGSHLDTVPHGGRLDGALGVLAGFEALLELKAAGFEPRRPIWLIAFMDEEGSRFGTSMFGSKAFVGEDVGHLGERADESGTSLAEAMDRAGFLLHEVAGAASVDQVAQYLELHIEQGPVLERTGNEIGVVSDICGLVGLRVRFAGEANHAGTTPMGMRRDALVGAARLILAVRAEMEERETGVATVGTINARPGAFNVIPGASELSVDIRSARAEELDQLVQRVERIASSIAEADGLEVSIQHVHRLEPTAMAPDLVELISRSAAAEGATYQVMASGAGHDAMTVGRHVASGMLFVPSRDGVSHNPKESSDPVACELGTRVLRRAVAELAGRPASD